MADIFPSPSYPLGAPGGAYPKRLFGRRMLREKPFTNRAGTWFRRIVMNRSCLRISSSRESTQRFIATFRQASLQAAEAAGVDGIVCGHIHKAELVERDGLVYCNDGDWVESCTTLTEDFEGRLSLLRWTESKQVITHSGALAPCSLEQAA